MMQLTTGVIFLMSSLYGSGQPNTTAQAAVIQAPVIAETTTTSSPMTTNTQAMEAFLRKEFADTPILVDIARCESNFHQYDKNGNIVRGIVNNADVGVMQINEKYHADSAKKMGLDLYTVEGNVEYAKHLYAEQGAQPWISSSKCWSAPQVATAK